MEKLGNALSEYNRRNFLKRGLQIGTALSVSPFLIDSLEAYEGETSHPHKRRRRCRLRRNSIFDIDDFDRISDEVWNERGPFGIFLQDELSHQGERMGPSSWEDLAFYTLAESTKGETLLIYIVPAFSGGYPSFFFRLLHRGYDDKTVMHGDTEQLDVTFQDKIKVINDHKRVIWKSRHFQIIAQPPLWHTLGVFKDPATGKKIKFDLLYKQAISEFVFYIPGMNPGRTGKGLHAPLTVEGELYVDGEKYVIKNGETTYERFVNPTRGMPFSERDWVNGYCGDINFLYHISPDGISEGFVCVQTSAGKEYFNFEDIDATRTEWWYDDQTGLTVPIKWHVIMTSSRGTFEAKLTAFDRVQMGSPATYVYNYLLSIDSKFIFPDGITVVEGNNGVGTNSYVFIPN